MEEDKSVLQHQNDEIMALNEEMYATEETLRENYDELERYKNRVEHYAFHDAKTGFYNSDYLLNMLHAKMNAKELKPYKLLAINICDLDDYREKLGQMLFEMLHYQVGTVLQSVIENEDQQKYITLFVVTYGQYAMLSEGCDRDELNRLLHLAYEKLQRLEIIDEVNLNITISVGGVEVENTDMKPEEQLEYAEAASLEAACQTGAIKRHHEIYWFYADLLEAKKFKTKLSIDLKHNLNLREFYVVYQPQYNVNHQIVSAEALLRWRHPELGEISPAVFVALAEKQGVIHKLGAFVQEQAMEMQKEMMIRHPNTPLRPIAINVSLIELMDSDYFDDLIQRLEDYQVPPQAIALEITESSVYNQLEDVLINIRRLNEAGVAIHLDDFGTGYASISHLNLFPLSVIKIDKTFIDHVANTTQQKTKTVVFSMIDMAHRLSLPVVAEGVETKAQFDALKEMGCDLFQGYYFSRPIRSEEWSERG
jgi:EAL domain-containing protein (putative c-di-GMP-specific phosphodiesterase class I)